jgi:CheY-like chemotaxis protein
VRADGMRLFQVFANLIHNAAKYTDPGGRLAIDARREGGEAMVRITDNGIGISAEMLPRVFDLFAQASGSTDRAQGGLGVGLTLVRSLVELHGGSVAAESGGTGQGSSFVVRLPLAPAVAPDERPAAIPAVAPAAARPLNVLVVDDNQDAADSMALTLRLMGHHAQTAYSGLAALQAAADLDADLILLDIGLPELDGHEVGRRLRRIAPRNAWFVALTGYGSDEDRRRSREAGFDEHVLKPLMPDALKSILSRAAARRLRPGGNQAAQGV